MKKKSKKTATKTATTEKWLSTADAARFIGRTPNYLWQLFANGKVKRRKNGKEAFSPCEYAESSLKAYVATNGKRKRRRKTKQVATDSSAAERVMRVPLVKDAEGNLRAASTVRLDLREELLFAFKCLDRKIYNQHQTLAFLRELAT